MATGGTTATGAKHSPMPAIPRPGTAIGSLGALDGDGVALGEHPLLFRDRLKNLLRAAERVINLNAG